MRATRFLLRAGLIAMLGLGFVVLMSSSAGAEPQSEEAQFIALINKLRVSKGLVPLAPDGQLTEVARGWSGAMAQAATLSHNPNFAQQMGNGWKKLGENVGVGASVDWLEQAFEASPHHYENLVDPDFRLIGVGIVDTADGQIWVTEDFEQARSTTAVPAPVKPAPNPTPAAAPRPKPAPRPAPAAAPVAKPAAQPAPDPTPPPPIEPPSTVPAPVVAGARTTRADQRNGQVLGTSLTSASRRRSAGIVGVVALLGLVVLGVRLGARARRRRIW